MGRCSRRGGRRLLVVCSERFIEWDEWTEIELGRGDGAHIHLAKLGLKLVRLLSKITSS